MRCEVFPTFRFRQNHSYQLIEIEIKLRNKHCETHYYENSLNAYQLISKEHYWLIVLIISNGEKKSSTTKITFLVDLVLKKSKVPFLLGSFYQLFETIARIHLFAASWWKLNKRSNFYSFFKLSFRTILEGKKLYACTSITILFTLFCIWSDFFL
jgi:hypothetical protein